MSTLHSWNKMVFRSNWGLQGSFESGLISSPTLLPQPPQLPITLLPQPPRLPNQIDGLAACAHGIETYSSARGPVEPVCDRVEHGVNSGRLTLVQQRRHLRNPHDVHPARDRLCPRDKELDEPRRVGEDLRSREARAREFMGA